MINVLVAVIQRNNSVQVLNVIIGVLIIVTVITLARTIFQKRAN